MSEIVECENHGEYTREARHDECPQCELMLAESRADDYRSLINEMRAGLQEIYSMRGEDELIAKICSPLIDRTQYL